MLGMFMQLRDEETSDDIAITDQCGINIPYAKFTITTVGDDVVPMFPPLVTILSLMKICMCAQQQNISQARQPASTGALGRCWRTL